MMRVAAGWLPIDVAPLGVVTWFAPRGPATALLASWLAVVCDPRPQLRAGCGYSGLDAGEFPDGTDFVVNVPGAPDSADYAAAHVLIRRLRAGAPLSSIGAPGLLPARKVCAPRLAGCALQIECTHGCLLPGDWETALAGELVLLHRGGVSLEPAAAGDFCALWPLRVSLPL